MFPSDQPKRWYDYLMAGILVKFIQMNLGSPLLISYGMILVAEVIECTKHYRRYYSSMEVYINGSARSYKEECDYWF